ncbi:MAG: hypothetical protein E4G89_07525, partial [Methanothrix sp.]
MGLYSDKLWKACRLIKEYNAKLAEIKLPAGVKAPRPVNDERFVEKLVKMGGVADELIRQCSWEELENCGLPRLLARDICKVFRANEVEPEEVVRQWKPLLKMWKLHWRDHIDLAEKLDAAAREHGWHLATEDHVEKKLDAKEFQALLIQIRDEHLYGSVETLELCPVKPDEELGKKWLPVLESWNLAWKDHLELAKRLEAVAVEEGYIGRRDKLEISNMTRGREFIKLLEDVRDEYLAAN